MKKYLGVLYAAKKESRADVNGPNDLFSDADKTRASVGHILD
ncbi:MAG: hypothetical protein AAFR76_13780 [Planctomycetota bacterium]